MFTLRHFSTTLTTLTLLLLVGAANTAWAQNDITVNSTADNTTAGNGACTLREAITNANNNSDSTSGDCNAGSDTETDRIKFNFSGSAPFIIRPTSELPQIKGRTDVNGASQPDNAQVCSKAIPSRPSYKVVLDGSNIGSGGPSGLQLLGGSDFSTIRGLNIRNFTTGIYINNSDDHTITCNFIGTNHNGNAAEGNASGILIEGGSNFYIGGTAPGDGNLISGNIWGIEILFASSQNHLIRGNYIGLKKNGQERLGNSQGIAISNGAKDITIGGTTSGARNVISSNSAGVLINGTATTGHVIQGNYIGTLANGNTASVQNREGIRIKAGSDITIGGSASGAGNRIASNDGQGVTISDGSTGVTVRGNQIFENNNVGIDLGDDGATANDTDDADSGDNKLQNYPVMTSAMIGGGILVATYSVDTAPANATYPLHVDFYLADVDDEEGQTYLGSDTYTNSEAQTQTTAIVAPAATVRNGDRIVATATDTDGNTSEFSAPVTAQNGNCLKVTTAADAGFGSLRLAMQCANAISGLNTIRFDIAGPGPHLITPLTTLPSITDRVVIDGSTQTDNGTVCTAAIDTRLAYEIVLDGGGAAFNGLTLDAGSDGSTIKGLNIRHFLDNGIEISNSTGNTIACNYIGTDAAGNTAIGNSNGIGISEGSSNTIGGTDAGDGNLISGNTNGITLINPNATDNHVQGNYIGTNKTGSASLANNIGVFITGGPSNNTIGGTVSGAGNLISGNTGGGVTLFEFVTGNRVEGNLIGTDASGSAALGNSGGVFILGASNNTIGGTDTGASNTIAYNTEDGIAVANFVHPFDGTIPSTENALLGNAIYQNGALGIDLRTNTNNNGVTNNDGGDGDGDPNQRQNYPVLAAAEVSGDLTVTYSVDTNPANATYPLRVEFFLADADDEEGQTYLGFDSYEQGEAQTSVQATFTPAVTPNDGDVILATATDADGNTSEFSIENATVVNNNIDLAVTVSESVDPVAAGSGTSNLVYTVTVTNNGPADATGVKLSKALTRPVGVTLESSTPSKGTAPLPGDDGLSTWTVGALASGASATLTYTLTVDATAQSGTDVIADSVMVTAVNEFDTDTTNDSAGEATSIRGTVDLAVTVSESADPVMAGSGVGNLVYTVAVTNQGVSDASGVELEHTLILPSGVTVDSALPSAGTFATDTWTLGALASGASDTLTVTLTVDASAQSGTDVIADTARVTAVNETDTDPSNDTDAEATSVSAGGGTTRYVTTTGTDVGNSCLLDASPCATLAHAVDQANAGDTIALDAGTYAESRLLINKALSLRGLGVLVR